MQLRHVQPRIWRRQVARLVGQETRFGVVAELWSDRSDASQIVSGPALLCQARPTSATNYRRRTPRWPPPLIRWRSRERDSRICSALLAQMNGRGFSFQAVTQLRMSFSRAWTLR
jgi:hypothetical protein